MTSFQGDVEALRGLVPQALDAARRAKDGWAEAYALNFAAVQEADAGRFEQSRELALAARDAAQRSTSHSSLQPLGLTWRLLGYWSLQAGDLERAGTTFEEAVTFLRGVREIWGLAILLSDLAALRVIEGRHEAAERAAEEALALCRRLRDCRGTGWCLADPRDAGNRARTCRAGGIAVWSGGCAAPQHRSHRPGDVLARSRSLRGSLAGGARRSRLPRCVRTGTKHSTRSHHGRGGAV